MSVLNFSCWTKQGVSLPLFKVRLLLHGHEQSRGSPSAAPEDGLDPCRRFREVHAVSRLPGGQLPPFDETDALPLPQVLVRGPGPGANVRPQVPPHGELFDTLNTTHRERDIIVKLSTLMT